MIARSLVACGALVPLLGAGAGSRGLVSDGGDEGDVVRLERDDTVVERSCSVVAPAAPIADANGDGVLRIVGDRVTVRFVGEAALSGAPADAGEGGDAFRGIGIVVTGRDVHLAGARVRGFKVGIHAVEADGLVLEDCDVSGNFRQHLGSTPEAEDGADWLWPHDNDRGEWAERYGAGIRVERSRGVTVRRCRARDGQNGLLLERVEEARVYDNDFSFLSGWGIALWRSSRNLLSRNALDFCVRGYSHGVYNRGQDSAGILMFEQCCENVLVENSVTHGGDGFFGFAGKEALGELAPPAPDFDYARRGNTGNLLLGNDFSYAAAHGIELTFSHGNRLLGNRLVGNAICGIWGGYSKETLIAGNAFETNGEGAYGLERGGVNIEHGERNRIVGNTFRGNACGVHLWWDPDEGLTKLPWSRVNGHGCGANEIVGNAFVADELAVQLRDCPENVVASNEYEDVGRALDATPGSEPRTETPADWNAPAIPEVQALGDARPIGARAHLRGREHIVVGPWGPWDHERPLLSRAADRGGSHVYRLLGPGAPVAVEATGGARARVVAGAAPPEIEVAARAPGAIHPYELTVRTADGVLRQSGLLVAADWDVTLFPWTVDPREDAEAWRAEAQRGVRLRLPSLTLPFAMGGPSELAAASAELRAAALPAERFGTLATARLAFPAGRWTIATRSDDGLRVSADGELLIDDWTWHAPKELAAELVLDVARVVELRVEHFELDGYALLTLEVRRAE